MHGERVKEVRKSLGLTLEKFGERLGVGKTAISHIERGNRNLTEQMTKSICREFGVNYVWLTTGEGEMFKPNPNSALDALAAEYGLDRKFRVVIEKFLELSPELRENMLNYLKDVAVALQEEDTRISDITTAEATHEKNFLL